MVLTAKWFSIALIVLSLFSACATTSYRQGVRHLNNKEYEEAVSLLRQAELQNPEDSKVKRDLGVALYKSEQVEEATAKLQEAKELDSRDSKTIFYLGLCYENQGRLEAAIDEYRNYRSLRGSTDFKDAISTRIKQLTHEKIARDINRALSQEQALDVQSIPENTVAVLYFQNLSGSEELDPLQKGLAQMLITDLSKAKKLSVVERLKLQKLLEELELGTTGLVEESSAPRVGKLIGARKLVKGGFTDLTEEDLRIDASLAETATTEISQVEEVTGKLEAFFQLEKDLAFGIIDDLGIVLTQEEREAIRKIPTESLLAFIAYSKGLDYEDRGMFDEARQQYQKAVEIDPNFAMARESLEEIEIAEKAATEPVMDLADLEEEFREDASPPDTRRSRLLISSMAAQTGQTPQGDNDTREPVIEAEGLDTATGNSATVPLRIPLPEEQ